MSRPPVNTHGRWPGRRPGHLSKGRTEVANLDRLLRKIGGMGQFTRDELASEVESSLVNIETFAKGQVPVLTGDLRDSIHREIDSEGLGGSVGTASPYAKAIEFGSRRSTAQPFLFPALEQEKREIVQRMKQRLRAAWRELAS